MRSGIETDRGAGKGLLIFDADDTLWYTGRLYDRAKAKAQELVAAEGWDGKAWYDRMEEIDKGNIKKMGLNRDRVPTSCAESYLEMAGVKAKEETVAAVKAAARGFMDKADLMEGVEEALSELVGEYRLVLLTQGDEELQVRRLEESGLKEYFSEVMIWPRKTGAMFAEALSKDGRKAEEVWSIGNSFPSDINPALLLGMNGIWIPGYEWESDVILEEAAMHKMVRVKSLGEMKETLLGGLALDE